MVFVGLLRKKLRFIVFEITYTTRFTWWVKIGFEIEEAGFFREEWTIVL